MAMFGYVEIFVAVPCLFFFSNLLLLHIRCAFLAWKRFLSRTKTRFNYLVTCDPMNVNHLLSKNFGNYVKGPEYHEIFEAFGEGILTPKSEMWKYHRETLHSVFKNRSFKMFVERLIQKKVKSGLIPVVNHVQKRGIEVDLQDILNRFNCDNACFMVLGFDPNCLSIHFPTLVFEKAFSEAEEAMFYKHTVPRSLWKLQSWLQIGEEKTYTKACKILNQFLHDSITSKRKEIQKKKKQQQQQSINPLNEVDYLDPMTPISSINSGKSEMEDPDVDLLTVLIRSAEEKGQAIDDKFLRDTAFNVFAAGRDSITSGLAWFFWLVATHPLVEAKILQEIKENYAGKEGEDMVLGMDEVKKLVYLHAAICEALRLFPPVPLERKRAIESDMLPSGYPIYANENILISLYAMGRSEEIWGEDCLEFKPDRWISNKGDIIQMPSCKFMIFNAGPRTCFGKDMCFIQMKIVISAILCNYSIQVVEDHPITPSRSIVLLMKYGLKVRITSRGI